MVLFCNFNIGFKKSIYATSDLTTIKASIEATNVDESVLVYASFVFGVSAFEAV